MAGTHRWLSGKSAASVTSRPSAYALSPAGLEHRGGRGWERKDAGFYGPEQGLADFSIKGQRVNILDLQVTWSLSQLFTSTVVTRSSHR